MNDTAVITLVVVSSALTVFLIVGILVLYNIVCLVKQVRRVVDKAESVASSVESAASAFEKSAAPMAALKVIGNIVENVSKFKQGKHNDK